MAKKLKEPTYRDVIPPKNLEAERGLIGSLMRKPEIYHEISGRVKAEHFYDHRHQIIFRTFGERVAEGLPINDPILIGEDLQANDLLGEVGGVQFFADLLSETLHAANAKHYAESIVTAAARRELHGSMVDRMKRLQDGADPQEIIQEIRKVADSFQFEAAPQWPALTSQELLEADFRSEWLINQILVKGQPGVIGGLKKTLKTNIAIDLAISLGSRTSFLGKYVVPRKVPVWMISGESGAATIQETAKRVARQRGISLESAAIHWTFKLPRLNRPKEVSEIRSYIKHHGIEVMILDPLYLSLGVGENQASNLYAMGEALAPIAEIGQETGCTILLAHHFRKNSANDKHTLPELSELAMAGVAEFARQWLLLGRRSDYEPGTGLHELWMVTGGSAGHSKSLSLDIDEGQVDDDFQGRIWNVNVEDAVDKIRELKDRRKQSQAKKSKDEQDKKDRFILALRDYPQGATKSKINSACGFSGETGNRIVYLLESEGIIEECDVKTPSGTRTGYKIKQTGQGSTRLDKVRQSNPERSDGQTDTL